DRSSPRASPPHHRARAGRERRTVEQSEIVVSPARARRWAYSTACETLQPSTNSRPSSSYGFESWPSLLRASVGPTRASVDPTAPDPLIGARESTNSRFRDPSRALGGQADKGQRWVPGVRSQLRDMRKKVQPVPRDEGVPILVEK